MSQKSKEFLLKLLRETLSLLLSAVILLSIISLFGTDKDDEQKHNIEYSKNIYAEDLQLKFYASKNTLADSINEYIKEVAPHSAMNAISFINECEEYDIDLFFVLAQCQLESNFATTGLGAKTRSAFNIKAYDGHSDKYMDKFKHPDMSIKPYLNIIKTTYLDHDTTELNLLDNYINHNGDRYASDPQYEAKLRGIYAKLLSKYSDAYEEYQKYKMLTSY